MSLSAERALQESGESAYYTGFSPAAQWVQVGLLQPGDSPRLGGDDVGHVQALADSDRPLPPILVHRQSMRVIDGMHRLAAAQLRKAVVIEVKFFDGSEDDAFVLAVQSNLAHGLPLTLADRKAAAARILSSFPCHSDRWVAEITQLAAATVATIRQSSQGDAQVLPRLGRDGRVRPIIAANGRELARNAIVQHPHASLREIARMAGISPGTVRDVRERIRRGEDPVPQRTREGRKQQHAASDPGGQAGMRSLEPAEDLRNPALLLERMRKDPSLRLTEQGRALLRWLDGRVGGFGDWEELTVGLPQHVLLILAELARGCVQEWRKVATQIDQCLQSRS